MSNIKDGGQAFPINDYVRNGVMASGSDGMTLRDYFAAKVMQGMAALPDDRTHPKDYSKSYDEWVGDVIAKDCRYVYRVAVAMLAERGRKES